MSRIATDCWPGGLRPRAALACALLISAQAACVPREVSFERPPIILIDVDTLRADHLGCYGYERPTSPQIDAFSEQAVRFEWAFSQAPYTAPSQASILTSLYPTSHGRIRKRQVMSPEVVTLAEALQGAGYWTAAFVDGGQMASGFGLEQGFEIYDDEAGGIETIGPKAFAWMRRLLSAAGDPADPFLLLIHSYDVHSPYEVSPRRYRSMFLDGLELPPRRFRKKMSGTMFKVWKTRDTETPLTLSPVELAYATAKYDSGIRHVDDWFGELLRFLDERGLLEPSIVVLFSDHGDELQEHGSLFHDRIYATVTRIPLILRLPAGRHAGVVVDQAVESIDLMPTLLELTGVEAPPQVQGRSLLPAIEGRRLSPRPAISESPRRGRVGVATADHRLILSRRGDAELYAYRADPLEQEDLAERLPGVRDELARILERWRERVAARRFEAGEVERIDPETLEQLRALGYVD